LKKKNSLTCLVFLIIIFSGCGEPVYLPTPNEYIVKSKRYSDVFEMFWYAMNENYAYWDIEPLGDWDSAYKTYKHQFEALGSYNDTIDTRSYQYFDEILKRLHDGHLSITSRFINNGNKYSPEKVRVEARYEKEDSKFLPLSFSDFRDKDTALKWENVEKALRSYGINGSVNTSDSVINMISMRIGITGTSDTSDYINYLYFNQFLIYENFFKSESVANVFKAYLKNLDSNCKGVIIDIRGNSGGDTADLSFVLGPLITEDFTFAYTRHKNGFDRLDFDPWIPFKIFAMQDGTLGYHRWANAGVSPVVVLCNDVSISCAELATLAVKAMPKGYVVGTQSYGAFGPRSNDNDPTVQMGGPFRITDAYGNPLIHVVQASQQTCGLNHENYDGVGIKPDKVVEFDRIAFENKTDVQLEAAIEHITAQIPR